MAAESMINPPGVAGDLRDGLLVEVQRVPASRRGEVARWCAGSASLACVRGSLEDGAIELALACSVIVAAPDVRLVAPEGRLPADPETPRRLTGRLGRAGALGFWLGDATWDAVRALDRGLVDEIAVDPVARGRELLALWNRSDGAAAVLADLVSRSGRLSERAARALERARFALAFSRDSAREGARRFFDER